MAAGTGPSAPVLRLRCHTRGPLMRPSLDSSLGRSAAGSLAERLAGLVAVAALLLAPFAAARGQEQFPGTSYVTPFPAGDIYRVQVYGDAFAEGLLGGLVDALADDSRVQLQRKRRPLAGITRP